MLRRKRSSRFALLAATLLLLIGCGGASDRGLALEPAAPTPRTLPRVWTFAVGVSTYSEANLNLEFAARDAEEIDRFFASQAGSEVPPSRRVLLTNARATRAEILGAFEKMTRLVSKDDLLVVFLAMHGIVSDRGDLYFAAYDTSASNIRGTGLANADVEQAVRDADVKHVLFLADTCHSGGVGLSGRRGVAAVETHRLEASLAGARPGSAILSASRGAELSQEDAKWGGGHGVFTHFVLTGMAGAADDNHDKLVTVSELYDFVYARVKDATSGAQHPELKGKFDNDMPVAALEAAPPKASPPAAPPPPAAAPPPPAVAGGPPQRELPLQLVIADLPAVERGALESAVARKSIAVVAYSPGSLKLLEACRARGTYDFTEHTGTGSRNVGSNEDPRHHFPLTGARFAPALKANGSVSLNMTYGGSYQAKEYLAERATLAGSCTGATHLIRRLNVGAFKITSGDELLDSAGDMKACGSGQGDARQQCRIGLEIEVVPLR